MESKLLRDYHTHTVYSHGHGSIEDNVSAAEKAGLNTIGIADHGPGHIGFGIKTAKLSKMVSDIEASRSAHPGIEVLLNVEANIINSSGELDVPKEYLGYFDRIIAGYHFGVFGDAPIKAFFTHAGNALYNITSGSTSHLRNSNTDLVLKALENNNIFILSHPGSKAPVSMKEIAKACAARGTLMEVNNHHDGLDVNGIRLAVECGAGLVISSDAHRPEKIGICDNAIARIKEAGISSSLITNLREDARWN